MASAGAAAAGPHFLAGAAPDAQLAADFTALAAWPEAAVRGALDVALLFLSSADAEHVAAALDGVVAAHGLKAAPVKRVVRSLALALGGAVKHAQTGDALGADLRALGAAARARRSARRSARAATRS